MLETESYSSDWSQLLDDMPNEPGNVVTPRTQTVTAGATGSGSIPISSSLASSNKTTASKGGSSSSTGTPNNSGNKGRFPFWILLLLLLLGGSASAAAGVNPVYRALQIVGIEAKDGRDGTNGIDGADGRDGKVIKQTNIISSNSSVTGSGSGSDGADGADGTNGADGADGAAGTNGADGADGTNACISGLCVSRQTTSPGTQESGNINIDGAVLATQIGINDTTPSDTLTVDGTVSASGHSAFGGETVDGYTNGSDGLSATSSNSTTMIVVEELTSITGSGMNRQAVAAGLVLNPGAAPVYNQISGVGGGVEIASGNTQNFTGNLSGYGGGFIHSGTGAVTFASSYNAGMLNLSTGTITNGNSFNSNVINLNAGGTVTNAHGLQASVINLGTITNNYGVKINTPTNGGTVTNNYGLYVADQSSVGSSITLNIYSAGVTSNNFFQGFVGIGSIAGPLDGQVHIVNDGSGNSFKVSDTDYADTSPFVINSTGQVGIGTTALGNRKLRVDGAIEASKVFFRAGADNDLYSSIFYDGADNMKYTAYDAHTFFTESGSGLTQKMIIDGNGNVGIGVDTPGVKLDVNGVIRGTKFSGVSGSTTWLSSDGSNTGLFVTDAANPQTGANRSFHVTTGAGESVPAFSVTGGGAANAVAVVKGAASQTADLQQWQDSSGNVLGSIGASGAMVLDSRTASTFLYIANNNANKQLRLGTTTSATSNWNIENSSGTMFFYNASAGGDTSIDLYDNTNVGIGTNFGGSAVKLTVKDSASAGAVLRLTNTAGTCDHTPGAVTETVSCSSDARLKTDISSAADVLSEINGLNVYDYTIIATGQKATGLIAQDVMQTNPEMVHMGEDGYYKVDSYNSWKLLKGIQELSSNIDNLQSTFTTALEQTNGNLEQTNQKLADLGLRVDDLSATLQSYADQLADHNQRIQSLEAKVQQLEQAN